MLKTIFQSLREKDTIRVDSGITMYEVSQCSACMLDDLESRPYNSDALIGVVKQTLLNKLILNLILGSLVILLEIQIKFRIPREINTFFLYLFSCKILWISVGLMKWQIEEGSCLSSLVKALMHLFCVVDWKEICSLIWRLRHLAKTKVAQLVIWLWS